MTKTFWALMAVLLLLLSGAAGAQAGEDAIPERVLGKKDAPVTMQEFASLTCTHCADFTVKVLPELEKRYIETGKLRYIYRDFPIDGIALKAAALARCMPAEQYYPFLNVLAKNQQQWAYGKDPDNTLTQYAKLGGLAEDKAKNCLQEPNMLDAIVASRTSAQEKYDIDSTPTFIFNEGKEKLIGARKLEEFTAVIDRLLAAAKH